MKRIIVGVIGALVATATIAQGQSKASDPQCRNTTPVTGPATQNTCNTALDLFNYMAPQLGSVIAGGNTTLGQGGSLGGPGHFVISVRGNAIKGSLPQLGTYTPGTTVGSTTIDTKDQVLALPAVDVAFGLFAGLPVGVTKVGGIDVLLNGSYIPAYSGGGVDVKVPSGSLKIGYGARVGLLEESLVVPGVGFSYMKRDLPTVSLTARSGTAGSTRVDVTNLRVNTTSWRVTASKSLIMFGLAAGAGQDKFSSSATIQGSAAGFSSGQFKGDQEITRTTYFGDVSFNLMLAKFVLEVGTTSGGDVPTYNTFSGTAADASRLFGSVGLRIGF